MYYPIFFISVNLQQSDDCIFAETNLKMISCVLHALWKFFWPLKVSICILVDFIDHCLGGIGYNLWRENFFGIASGIDWMLKMINWEMTEFTTGLLMYANTKITWGSNLDNNTVISWTILPFYSGPQRRHCQYVYDGGTMFGPLKDKMVASRDNSSTEDFLEYATLF